jgi:hypothetical protein
MSPDTKRFRRDQNAILLAVNEIPWQVQHSLPRGCHIKGLIHDEEIAWELHDDYGGFICSSFDYRELVKTALEMRLKWFDSQLPIAS